MTVSNKCQRFMKKMDEEIPAKRYEESGGDAKKPLFRELNADDDEPEASEIESLCVNCEESVSETSLSFLLYAKTSFVSGFGKKDVVLLLAFIIVEI